MLRIYILLACLALSVFGEDNYFKVLIREIDNPAGTLIDGSPCSEFGFLGAGCNTYLRAAVSGTRQNVSIPLTGDGTLLNTHMETRISNINLIVADTNGPNGIDFSGFDLHITLASDSNFVKLIDDYTFHVSTTQMQGVYTYTSLRANSLATTISIAWSTNIPPPSTTSTPEPTTTGVLFTGSTAAPTTTPKPPVDCSEILNLTSGVNTIYPDGATGVSVYCDLTSYGAYTVIQSRGTTGQNISFDLPLANFSNSFGTPGKGNNYWFGLDNMNNISSNVGKSYNLQIDLCCGTQLIAKQIYHTFKVADKASQYKLTATADISGIGLDFSSTFKDLGAIFQTHAEYKLPKGKPWCDELTFVDEDTQFETVPYGGWWFGSCGNNLNGFLYPSRNLNCTVPLETFNVNGMLGVNMRTTEPAYLTNDIDFKSYDRVRMALFTFDPVTVDKTDATFCQG